MANQRKRISELTALTSASLDTTIVGVDNGVTYKIELDTLADAVTSRVNILDRDRLVALEFVTASFETKGRSIISSSAQITTLGFVSSSTNISSLNIFTQSIDSRVDNLESQTGSYLTSLNGTISSSAQITTLGFVSSSTDITLLNSFTSSQSTLNTAFTNGINARLQTSSFNEYTASISTASLVTSISNLNSATSSYLTSLSGAISSSSQLTSSYDSRYIVSGSISAVPAGTISGSSQLTSSFDTRYALSASFVSSSNLSSIQTITSASYAALTPVSGTLYIIIG